MVTKLRRLRKRLKPWSYQNFGSTRDKNASFDGRDWGVGKKRKREANLSYKELHKLRQRFLEPKLRKCAEKEIVWKHKGRCTRLRGDNNIKGWIPSSVFSLMATLSLSTDRDIRSTVASFILQRPGWQRMSCNPSLWENTPSQPQIEGEELENPFHRGRDKLAIWQLGPDKAPGPDGFPVYFFYRQFWNIKYDVCKLL